MSTLNRRTFLAAGIGTGMALATPTLSHAATATPKPDTDILIVGGGFAGLTAAVTAARSGASVRVIDKRIWLGGDGILSSGILYAARTPYHDKAGIKDGLTKDDFWKYWTTSNATSFDGSHTKSNPKVMRATCDLSTDVIAFIASYGIQFNPVSPAKPFQLSTVAGSMSKFAQGMIDELKTKGIVPELGVTAKILLMDGERVVGVEAVGADGKTKKIYAKAVVLATGGYLDSKYLFERYKPYWAKVPSSIGNFGEKRTEDRTGDGIIMGKAIGVALEDMEATPGLNARTPVGIPFVSWTLFDVEPAYLVTAKGKRIIDEHKNRYIGCCLELLKRGEEKGFAIFGEETFSGPNAKRFKFADVIKKGAIFKGNTPEELAQAAGIDPKGLKETIERINRDAAAGRDSEYGRTDKVFRALKAPYYATHAAFPIKYATEGGLETDESFRALRLVDDKPVPGLYAIGTCAGEITLHLSDVLASGLIAGKSAASEVK